jgi:predicted unusual protein kinase regulating ubiquinone biosynthesis (AarF/ABC1/UbiB family)
VLRTKIKRLFIIIFDGFRDLFHDEKRGFYVPKVIDELSSKRVLTTEFIKGDSMDFISENYT